MIYLLDSDDRQPCVAEEERTARQLEARGWHRVSSDEHWDAWQDQDMQDYDRMLDELVTMPRLRERKVGE
jgi:hypothetical protein